MVELDEYAHYNLEPTVFGVLDVATHSCMQGRSEYPEETHSPGHTPNDSKQAPAAKTHTATELLFPSHGAGRGGSVCPYPLRTTLGSSLLSPLRIPSQGRTSKLTFYFVQLPSSGVHLLLQPLLGTKEAASALGAAQSGLAGMRHFWSISGGIEHVRWWWCVVLGVAEIERLRGGQVGALTMPRVW
jgi:hypothetical protein